MLSKLTTKFLVYANSRELVSLLYILIVVRRHPPERGVPGLKLARPLFYALVRAWGPSPECGRGKVRCKCWP